MKLGCLLLAACIALLVRAEAEHITSGSSRWHHRSLKVAPLPVPAPFAFPKDIADAARNAASSGTTAAFAADLCGKLANKDIQGSREYRDTDGVKLYPMFLNLARAATVYPDTVSTLGLVLAKCDELGGLAAEGVGYGLAFIYSKGLVEALGTTQMLESIYDKKGGCLAMDHIMDIAAAVIKSRDVALDELRLAMKSYSPRLEACTPRDSEQRFKAYSLKGDVGVIKPKGSLSLQLSDETKAKAPAPAGSGSKAGSAANGGRGTASGGSRGSAPVALERGRDTTGH